MIRLFVTDLDGCISHPFRAPAWDALVELARLHAQRHAEPAIPPLTLCTGRPLPYAEAVAQWLSVTTPILFESGSGMYDPVAHQVRWSPRIGARTERALERLRGRIHGELVPRYPGTLAELAKHKDVGVIHPDPRVIETLREIIASMAAEHADADIEVHHTEISVSVIPRAANKGAGLRWLGEHLGIAPADMAYIGDSAGDLPAIEQAGMAFAPSNAVVTVKAKAEVTRGEATAGVLEAYRAVIEHNRRAAGPAGTARGNAPGQQTRA